MKDTFTQLIRAAHDEPAITSDFDRRVMIEIAQRAIARSKKRARRGMIASMAGTAMLLAGCVAALVVWFPALLPAFSRTSWLDWMRRIPSPWFLKGPSVGSIGETATAALPFLEQWGGLLFMALAAAAAMGIVHYLNNLFPGDYSPD